MEAYHVLCMLSIFLPTLPLKTYRYVSHHTMLYELPLRYGNPYAKYEAFELYGCGAYRIQKDCFKGLKKVRLLVPVDYSISLDYDCFDTDAEVEFVLPENMTLKNVQTIFLNDCKWNLLCHKDYRYTPTKPYDGSAEIFVEEFKQQPNLASFRVSKDVLVKQGDAFVVKRGDTSNRTAEQPADDNGRKR